MNDQFTSPSSYGYGWPRFPTLDEWHDAFASIEIADDYPRSTTVVIPHELSDIYDTGTVTVSIRAVLTLAALHNPNDAERLLALRDAHYGGDVKEDYFIQSTARPFIEGLSPLERATAKAARAVGFSEREARRRLLEEEAAVPYPDEEPDTYDLSHPFHNERLELAAEFDALKKREEAYEAECHRLVAYGGFSQAEHDLWAKWTTDLDEEKDAIARGFHEYAKRYRELGDIVWLSSRSQTTGEPQQ